MTRFYLDENPTARNEQNPITDKRSKLVGLFFSRLLFWTTNVQTNTIERGRRVVLSELNPVHWKRSKVPSGFQAQERYRKSTVCLKKYYRFRRNRRVFEETEHSSFCAYAVVVETRSLFPLAYTSRDAYIIRYTATPSPARTHHCTTRIYITAVSDISTRRRRFSI